jgi:methylglutamate dehydrogenase subunit B
MRLNCPWCGLRDRQEFVYYQSALIVERPEPAAPDAAQHFYEYTYLRDNPAGPNAELWYHQAGCRAWLKVVRDTRTHEVISCQMVSGVDA